MATHLLIVDDEPTILTTLQKALQMEGYSVDVAGGVKVADETLKKRSYDLCLFDVQLPDGDGLSLLAGLRQAKSEQNSAECELSNAENEIAKWLLPKNATKGETFLLAVGSKFLRVCLDERVAHSEGGQVRIPKIVVDWRDGQPPHMSEI
jgi:CheY-like chemotaxis protein